ncbi:MAG: carboxypeptidase regulatory-like domain-containing protein [Acidobacteria bacterium]|nr:carboxypeptidase regulatory-like domain-containing protein [Acidobacteriota bacterium]
MSRAVLTLVLVAIAASAGAQQAGPQMPDPRQMSGVPLPTGDLPVGTITVRVIRGSLSNPLPGQRVEIIGDAQASGTTNESGRAEFPNLRPGATIRATAVVDGEKLESQQIQMPSAGGIRVMLVATDPEAEKRAEQDRELARGPSQRGTVVLGDQSRFVFELGDEGLNVFNIVQILNTARVPVEPVSPVSFELPAGATHAALLEGSSPLAAVVDGRVNVRGPFPPGMTLVQFAYTLPLEGSALTVRQVVPAPLAQLTVIAQKVGGMRLASSQLAQQRDMNSEGRLYILGQGPALAAGGAVEFSFTGLPHSPTWPRNVALTLAILVLAGGAWISVRPHGAPAQSRDRERLHERREKLFDELTALEESHRDGRVDPAVYSSRRQHLIASLERIYAALDEDAAA